MGFIDLTGLVSFILPAVPSKKAAKTPAAKDGNKVPPEPAAQPKEIQVPIATYNAFENAEKFWSDTAHANDKLTREQLKEWGRPFYDLVAGEDGLVSREEFESEKAAIQLYVLTYGVKSLEEGVKLFVEAKKFDVRNIVEVGRTKEGMRGEFFSKVEALKKDPSNLQKTDGQLFLDVMKDSKYTGKSDDVYNLMEAYAKANPNAGFEELFTHFFSCFEASRFNFDLQKSAFGITTPLNRASTGLAKDVVGWFKGEEGAGMNQSGLSDSAQGRELDKIDGPLEKKRTDWRTISTSGDLDDPDVDNYYNKLKELLEKYPDVKAFRTRMKQFIDYVLEVGVGKCLKGGFDNIEGVNKALEWVDRYAEFVGNGNVADRANISANRSEIANKCIDLGRSSKNPAEQDRFIARAIQIVAPLGDEYKASTYTYLMEFLLAHGRPADAKDVLDGKKGHEFISADGKRENAVMPKRDESWLTYKSICQQLAQISAYYPDNKAFGEAVKKYLPKGMEGERTSEGAGGKGSGPGPAQPDYKKYLKDGKINLKDVPANERAAVEQQAGANGIAVNR